MDKSADSLRRRLPRSFFERDVDCVARDLIGTAFTFEKVGGVIVETESYDSRDPASHSYGERLTQRNRTMFGPPGRIYVYRSYGIHWCANFVCGAGSAVLIRALEPCHGVERMRERRGTIEITALCAGPGRLCEALGITKEQDGMPLDAPPFALIASREPAIVCTGVRIGISKAREALRRYGLTGSAFLSRRFANDGT